MATPTDDAAQRVRTGLVEMASLVLGQVESGVRAWELVDDETAARVIASDDAVDERCALLDAQIFEIQSRGDVEIADRRLLHVGLIAAIALERVGDLGVAIAEQARSVRPEGAVPQAQALISRMSARAIDALANSVQAIARGDVELGEQAAEQAQRVHEMLVELLAIVSAGPDEPESRAWSAAAVLVGRHLDRVANNGSELGGRVRFMVSGERFPPALTQ